MKKILLFLVILFAGVTFATAQNMQVSGKVTYADDGSPVVGATILVKGTGVATLSDINGLYQITVPASSDKALVVSYAGLVPQEQAVSSAGQVINFVMATDAQSIDEVIIVAYGTARKSSFTGSAAVVSGAEISAVPHASFTKALEGLAAGVQVSGGSGQPGSGANVRIRGIGSINASSAPLYVVDGAAFDGDINSINVDDIESISVLKDASAASLYGARGANGVIMVTTKRGKAGKPTVSARVNIGLTSRAITEYDRVNSNQYMQGMFDARVNALTNANGYSREKAIATARGIIPGGTEAKPDYRGVIGNLGGYNPYNMQTTSDLFDINGKLNPNAKLMYQDDWEDALSRTGLVQDYNASVSGGSDKATYMFSMGYYNEEGYVKFSDFERINATASGTAQVTDWFKADARVAATSSQQWGPMAEGTYTTNPFYYSRMMGPIYPIYQRNEDGSIRQVDGKDMYDMGGGASEYAWTGHTRPYAPNSNLLVTLPLDQRGNKSNTISANVGAEFKFLKDFTFRVTGSTNILNKYETTYQNNKYGDAVGVKGRSTKEYVQESSYTFNQVLNYNKQIGDHHISVMAGHENYSYNRNLLEATRVGFNVPSDELVAGATAEGSTSYSDNYRLEGYFGRAEYNYANKYMISGSVRADGSSRFAPESRWGVFWSAGASWRISQESWMQDVDWIDNLTLRASYGEQGNDNLLNALGNPIYYAYQNLYELGYNNGNAVGALMGQIGSPDLQWEKNGNLNVGIDFRMFNRWNASIEYFHRNSDNLLFNVPLPESTGISSIMSNVGSMYNAGIEVAMDVDVIRTKDVVWNIGFNFTAYKNEITKLPEDSRENGIISGSKKLMEGHSIYEFWLRESAGVDQADGSALYYQDTKDSAGNVTGRTTTKDAAEASYYFAGDAIPDAFGSISTSLRLFNFDFSMMLTYQIGGDMLDYNYAQLMHTGNYGSHWSSDILNAWQQPGDITDVPRIQNGYSDGNAMSTRYITDASYLSLRNITIGYSLPKSALKKIDLQNLRFYVAGENLFMLTARQGLDPQATSNGTNDNTYVPRSMVTFGLNLTF